MPIQLISTPLIESNIKPFVLPKTEWLGKQISILGKTLYSQLARITNLFYQTIKTHPKKSLAAATIILLIYYKGKTLVTFLKPLKPDIEEKILQQKMKAFSEKSQKLEKSLSTLRDIFTVIDSSQKAIYDKTFEIKNKYDEISATFIEVNQPLPQTGQSREKCKLLEQKIQVLQNLEPNIQNLIKNATDYKNSISDFSNPFMP